MTTRTYHATTFDQACDLCRFFDEHPSGVCFENEGLEVRVRVADLTEEMHKAAVEIIHPPVTPSNQTGLSGCGVHSFYVD